jgi:hypothetical protein
MDPRAVSDYRPYTWLEIYLAVEQISRLNLHTLNYDYSVEK